VDPASGARIGALLREAPDWTWIRQTVHHQGILPLVYHSLSEGLASLVPDGVRRELQRAAYGWSLVSLGQVSRLCDLRRRFESEGVSALLFKGLALAAQAYGNLALRKPGDLDLLLHKPDFLKAGRILYAQGYRAEVGPAEVAAHIEKQKGVTFYHARGNVDLHWTLDDDPLPVGLDTRGVWERAANVLLAGRAVQSLSPEDHLHFLCCHGAKHHWVRLYLICDVAELVRRHPEMAWPALLERARQARCERMLHLGLLLAAGLLHAPLPGEVRQRIASDRGAVFTARRTIGWLFGEPRRFDANLCRFYLLEGLRPKITYFLHRWRRRRAAPR
jgi:hypothetical protein